MGAGVSIRLTDCMIVDTERDLRDEGGGLVALSRSPRVLAPFWLGLISCGWAQDLRPRVYRIGATHRPR